VPRCAQHLRARRRERGGDLLGPDQAAAELESVQCATDIDCEEGKWCVESISNVSGNWCEPITDQGSYDGTPPFYQSHVVAPAPNAYRCTKDSECSTAQACRQFYFGQPNQVSPEEVKLCTNVLPTDSTCKANWECASDLCYRDVNGTATCHAAATDCSSSILGCSGDLVCRPAGIPSSMYCLPRAQIGELCTHNTDCEGVGVVCSGDVCTQL
jgi:hypothetical protein